MQIHLINNSQCAADCVGILTVIRYNTVSGWCVESMHYWKNRSKYTRPFERWNMTRMSKRRNARTPTNDNKRANDGSVTNDNGEVDYQKNRSTRETWVAEQEFVIWTYNHKKTIDRIRRQVRETSQQWAWTMSVGPFGVIITSGTASAKA